MAEIIIPVVAGRVVMSSPFGMREDGMHRGADFTPRPRGNPDILSFDVGTVIHVWKMNNTAGNWVDIWHPSLGITTTYMHLDWVASDIREGTTVTRGQRIGAMGTTGLSTVVHLHFEESPQRGRGNQVDPMPRLLGGVGGNALVSSPSPQPTPQPATQPAPQPTPQPTTPQVPQPAPQPTPPSIPTPQSPPSNTAAASQRFRIQIGAGPNLEGAQYLVRRAAEFGHVATIRTNNNDMHHVEIGEFSNRADADRLAAVLQGHGFDTWVRN